MVILSKSDHLSSPIGTKKPDPNGFRTQRKEKAMFSTGRTNNCMMCMRMLNSRLIIWPGALTCFHVVDQYA